MKKLGIIISIVAILAIAGCASSGGGSSSGGGGEGGSYSVDLSTLKIVPLNKQTNEVGSPISGATVRNLQPFAQNYDDLFVVLPEFPVDVTKFQRLTIRVKYFDANGEEISQGDGNAMISIIEDINDSKNIRGGAAEGVYPNIPFKQYNLGGFSGTISSDKGARLRYTKAPGGILFQNSNIGVKFIEVTEITFHD